MKIYLDKISRIRSVFLISKGRVNIVNKVMCVIIRCIADKMIEIVKELSLIRHLQSRQAGRSNIIMHKYSTEFSPEGLRT